MKTWVDVYNERARSYKSALEVGDYYLGPRVLTPKELAIEGRRLVSILQPRPVDTLLDLGSCAGVSVGLLKRHFKSVVGVDLAPDALAMARRRHPDVTFVLDDITRLAHIRRAFSRVCAYGVFHYLGSLNAARRAVRAIRRVTRPGARVLLTRVPDLVWKKEYVRWRSGVKTTRAFRKKNSPVWLWYPESFFLKEFSPDFSVSILRPVFVFEPPMAAFYDVMAIRR